MAEKSLGADCAPCNVIPFPVTYRAPDPRRDFLRACIAVEAARARYDLSFALCDLARMDGDEAEREAARADHLRAFDELQAATDALATVPAPSRPFLDRKRRAIGRIWLTAEGDRYDRLRAGIAADEAALGVRRGNG